MAYDEGFIINQERPAENDGVRADFYLDAVIDGVEAKRIGRPVYKDVEFVRIRVLGDKTSTICHRVTDDHRKRFPAEYARFQASINDQITSGTPLKMWAALTVSKVREFSEAGIKSVEQLASANPDRLGGDAREYVEMAQNWLKSTADLMEENRLLKARIAELEGDGSVRRRGRRAAA